MSRKGFIDSALYRPLKSGGEYNKLIPSSSCEKTDLGTGDTYLSMDLIKANIEKNHGQVKKLAPLLKKSTLSETVTAIYQFLYSHIQYRADGSDQNLRSPACSWAARNEGIDCKSYSIFAGCLLAEMGHKFYIRKIKQPGMAPEEFTHVYIIVPKDQKNGKLNAGYFVIDSTKHHNTEAAYIAKNDIFMSLQHFGLQAPAPTASIKGKIQQVPPKAIQGLKDFLCFLRKVGIDKRIIAEIENTIMGHIQNGVDPYFAVTDKGIVIENYLIPFHVPNFGKKQYRSPISIAIEEQEGGTGLKADWSATAGEIGKELGGLVMDGIGKSSWWDNTFGAIFGNGWDTTCWGASNTPQKSAIQVQYDTGQYFEFSNLGNISKGGLTTQNLQYFVDIASAYIAHRQFGASNGDLAKCTRKANETGMEGMREALYYVVSSARNLLRENGGDLKDEGEKVLSSYSYPIPSGYLNGGMANDGRFVTKSRKYTVIPAPEPVVIPPPANTGGSINNGGGSSNTGGSNTGGSNTGGNSSIGGGSSNTGGSNTGGTTSTGGSSNTGGSTSTGGSKDPNKQLINSSTVNKNNSPQQAGISPIIVVGLIAGGIYLATKKDKTKAKKK